MKTFMSDSSLGWMHGSDGDAGTILMKREDLQPGRVFSSSHNWRDHKISPAGVKHE